eukprot:scaffold175027_cov37-Tisochrysis_lutea.AAC.2
MMICFTSRRPTERWETHVHLALVRYLPPPALIETRREDGFGAQRIRGLKRSLSSWGRERGGRSGSLRIYGTGTGTGDCAGSFRHSVRWLWGRGPPSSLCLSRSVEERMGRSQRLLSLRTSRSPRAAGAGP